MDAARHATPFDRWFDDWVHGPPVPPPADWGRPGLLLLFNLECAGCVSRAVPWLKRAERAVGDRAVLLAAHTAYGHRPYPREDVVPRLTHYATAVADLPWSVAIDVDGLWAERAGAQGTPHWLVWNERGVLERSLYGSQENALTRLAYVLEDWGVELGP